MSSSKIRLAFGIIWIISGLSKVFGIIAEVLTGKAMISVSMSYFAKLSILPFYTDIIAHYFVPSAILFIFLAALSEIIAGSLILQTGNRAKLGLVIGIAMNITYAPLAGIATVIVNILFATPQAWLLGQDSSENLSKCRK